VQQQQQQPFIVLTETKFSYRNTGFFKCLTATLDVAQGFSLLTEGAVRGVFFAPLVEKGATGEL
jgi:hypothetical protein